MKSATRAYRKFLGSKRPQLEERARSVVDPLVTAQTNWFPSIVGRRAMSLISTSERSSSKFPLISLSLFCSLNMALYTYSKLISFESSKSDWLWRNKSGWRGNLILDPFKGVGRRGRGRGWRQVLWRSLREATAAPGGEGRPTGEQGSWVGRMANIHIGPALGSVTIFLLDCADSRPRQDLLRAPSHPT